MFSLHYCIFIILRSLYKFSLGGTSTIPSLLYSRLCAIKWSVQHLSQIARWESTQEKKYRLPLLWSSWLIFVFACLSVMILTSVNLLHYCCKELPDGLVFHPIGLVKGVFGGLNFGGMDGLSIWVLLELLRILIWLLLSTGTAPAEGNNGCLRSWLPFSARQLFQKVKKCSPERLGLFLTLFKASWATFWHSIWQ